MKIDTKCLHEGYQPQNGEPRQIPIYQSTTFRYDSSEEMGKLFDLERSGYFYSRLQNPTNDAVAAKIAAMEGGVAGMLTSSGQAANFFAVFNICEAGDHFIASSAIYGGTYNLFGVTMKKMGIECTFVDPHTQRSTVEHCFRPNTKCIFGETITNPTVGIFDIEKFAAIAHRHGVPLIIDNTFATPVNCRPIEWGCDIVTHSTTKYMDGHGVAVGGVIVDSGRFDWEAHAEKFPGLTTPDASYHGLTYTKKFGKLAYITKATSQLMRDLGAIQSPQNAFYLQLGLESLAVRMKRHCDNALAVARFLKSRGRSRMGPLCRTGRRQRSCACAEILPTGHLRRARLRLEGQPGEGRKVHGFPAAGDHRHSCGGCPYLSAASGQPTPTASSATNS